MEVVFYKGEFTPIDNVAISSSNRAFNYGDGFFETVKIINSKLFNFSSHRRRINLALSILKIQDNYTTRFLKEKAYKLIEINNITNGSIKIHISRSGIGRYLPESNQTELFINTIDASAYRKNNAISLCFYENEYKSSSPLSNIKSVNSLVSVLASIHSNESNYDNAILLNNSGNIIEITNANIFIVKNREIFTPPISEGCVDGTMRRWTCNQIDVFEKKISKNDILYANEVFVTNASSGFTAVKTIEKITFSSFKTTNVLQKKLINSSLGL